jgi:hypothetical protein
MNPNIVDVKRIIICATTWPIFSMWVFAVCLLLDSSLIYMQLPDAFQDFVSQNFDGKRPSDALMTHCRRELLHAQWDVLLDDDFLTTYKHGTVVDCCDGIMRRFYPRFFTYSADYKEKSVLPLFSVRDVSD